MILVGIFGVIFWMVAPLFSEARSDDLIALTLALIVFAFIAAPAVGAGLGVALLRRDTAQREALQWLLMTACRHDLPIAPVARSFADGSAHSVLPKLLTIVLCPPVGVLATLARWGTFRSRAQSFARDLERGAPLPDAVDAHPGLFTLQDAVTVRVGAETGQTDEALRRCLAADRRARDVARAVTSRLWYLGLVFVMMQGMVVCSAWSFLPRFESTLADFSAPVPEVTRILLQFNSFMTEHQWDWQPVMLVLLAELACLFWLIMVISGQWPAPPLLFDRLFPRKDGAAVLRVMGLGVAAGQPLAANLKTQMRYCRKGWLRGRLLRVFEALLDGRDWIEVLRRQRLVRRVDAEVLHAAERAGNLGWALDQTAESIDRRWEGAIKALTQWMLPVCIFGLGGVMLFIAVAFFLPLVQMIEALL
jgi:type II secretory pathway component PulF